MGGGKKRDKKEIYTNNDPPAMEECWEPALPRGADRGRLGARGYFWPFYSFCCPGTWVVSIVKGDSRQVVEGTGESKGGQPGLVALLGRCQKNKTKHVFILSAPAWAQASAREREGEGGARRQ